MSDAISSILSQIRAHQSHAAMRADAPAGNAIDPSLLNPGPGAARPADGPGFSETMAKAHRKASRCFTGVSSARSISAVSR